VTTGDIPLPDGWADAITQDDWCALVAAAVHRHFAEGGWLLEPAVLLDAWCELDVDGMGVLRAVYQHPFWPQRTGLRRRLDTPPPLPPDAGQGLADWLAAWIATFEISEPLGRMYDLLVEDETGVFWWGDGYRDISEHPDFGGDLDGWLRDQLAEQGHGQEQERQLPPSETSDAQPPCGRGSTHDSSDSCSQPSHE
jgi:hypothetical protein